MSDARDRTLSHLQRLVATATVLGAGAAAAATPGCKKETVSPKDELDAGANTQSASADASTDAAAEPAASAAASADPDATAPSTLDSTAFADAGGPHAKKDAGPKHPPPRPPPTRGYAVVDPMPPPARLPKNEKCDPPFFIDANGVKHYKPECLK